MHLLFKGSDPVYLFPFTSINSLGKTISEVSELLQRHKDNSDSNALYDLCVKTNELALIVRSHFRQSDIADHKADLSYMLWEMGYVFDWDASDIATITLPLLLPKRGGDVDFITKPLAELLSLEKKRKRFKECTIVYEHIYSNKKRAAAMRDADNLEIRSVQNVLERYLLTSDSALYCTTIHATKFGGNDETNITIFPMKMNCWNINLYFKSVEDRILGMQKQVSP